MTLQSILKQIPDPGIDDRNAPEQHSCYPGRQARHHHDNKGKTSCGGHTHQPLHTEDGFKGKMILMHVYCLPSALVMHSDTNTATETCAPDAGLKECVCGGVCVTYASYGGGEEGKLQQADDLTPW